MGIVSTVLGFTGFGVGLSAGVVIGYFLFIYFQPCDVKDPVVRPLVEQDSQSLQQLLPEIPLWVKSPDYERVDWLNKFLEYMWPYLDKTEAAINRIPALNNVVGPDAAGIWGCDHCPSGKCCYCSIARTRPICAYCCDEQAAAVGNATTPL